MTTRQLWLTAILTLLVAFNAGMFFAGWRCFHATELEFAHQFGVPQMQCVGWQR